jgi:hypothetical protein
LTNSNDHRIENRNKEEFFTLDYSLFDIVPTPPDLTKDMTSPGSGSKPATSIPHNSSPLKRHRSAYTQPDHNSPKQADNQGFLIPSSSTSIFPIAPVSTKTDFLSSHDIYTPANNSWAAQPDPPKSPNVKMDETGVPDNDLAELEAWLLSDAVIITD